MIDTFLARAAALLARFAFWRQRGTESAESTPAEDAALLTTLNPPYRLYFCGKSERMHDIGVDRVSGTRGSGEVNPIPVEQTHEAATRCRAERKLADGWQG